MPEPKHIEKKIDELTSQCNGGIHDTTLSTDQRVSRIIHATGAICGVLATQPLPFADIVILTPIQIVMVMNIGKVYGFSLNKNLASLISL